MDGRSTTALAAGNRVEDAGDVLATFDVLNVPAVRLVSLSDVFAESDGGVVLDGDLVVVVEDDEVAQFLDTGEGRGLGRDAFFDVTVGRDHVDVMVEGGGADRGLRIEQSALTTRSHRHADCGRKALAQRTGGHLDADGVADLGVAGGQCAPRAESFEVSELETVARQVELGVQRQG